MTLGFPEAVRKETEEEMRSEHEGQGGEGTGTRGKGSRVINEGVTEWREEMREAVKESLM